nr:hypothetical protein [Tanacetum cinerariifolium]
MSLTFADTHNIVAYLNKSDASEGFTHVIDFLNGSYIKLQALVDRKKVVITETAIRDVLRLDDADGVDCLPNEEIFVELARMGYGKPSTKLTFYKAFFSSQWKFLIHTILQSMSAKCTSWNEFSSAMASAVICLSTGDLSTHTTKYTSSALTQKDFVNKRRVGKRFLWVETPLFEGMLVARDIEEQGDDVQDQSIPSPTPPTPPPQQPQDLPSTSQEALDACTALTKRVEHLEIVPDEDDDVYTEATPLARKVPVVDYQIIKLNNKPRYKIIRADGTHQLAMFKRPNGQDQVWESQRSVHGQAMVKSWKLLESCGVHIISFTTTQLILLVERRYPLSRFTIHQMLNVVRLRVKEESEMSLELLRFTRKQHQECQQE